jgi:hypothetical protein
MEGAMPLDFAAESARLSAELKKKPPPIKVDDMLFEASRSHGAANEQRDPLLATPGFKASYLDNIPELCKVLFDSNLECRHSLDKKSKLSHRPAREEADQLIRTVVQGGSYLCRNDPDAMRDLERIGSPENMADRYGDLQRVASFCDSHPELVGSDARFQNAAARARALADALATVPNYEESEKALERRNIAYWLLDEALTEVCKAVRFRFADNPTFVSRVCDKYEATRKKAKEEQATAPAPRTDSTIE